MFDFLFAPTGPSVEEHALRGSTASEQLPGVVRYLEQRIDALSERIARLEKKLTDSGLSNHVAGTD